MSGDGHSSASSCMSSTRLEFFLTLGGFFFPSVSLLAPFDDAMSLLFITQFTGGTECDLTGVLRSTTVHLKCGSLQQVREVIEDRTCHYRILAISPLLCRYRGLRHLSITLFRIEACRRALPKALSQSSYFLRQTCNNPTRAILSQSSGLSWAGAIKCAVLSFVKSDNSRYSAFQG